MKSLLFYTAVLPLVLCFSFAITAQNLPDIIQQSRLELGKPVARQIGGGETHEYEIKMAANDFLSIEVDQTGMGVITRLTAPDGKTVAEVASPFGRYVTERLWYVAPTEGTYKLQIFGDEKQGIAGKYEVEIAGLQQANEKSAQTVAAAKLSAEAYALQEQRTADAFTAAIAKHNEAIKLASSSGERHIELASRGWLGIIYVLIRQPQSALEQNEKAIDLARKLQEPAIEAYILENFGRIYYETEPAKAIGYYSQALNLRNAIGARTEMTTALNAVGAIYSNSGEYEKALDYFNRTLAIYRETEDVKEGTAVANIGAIYGFLGEHRKAIDTYQQALAILRKAKIGFFEVQLLSNIGSSYDILGEPQKAIDYLNEALIVARTTGNRQVEAKILGNIGNFYQRLGDDENAFDHLSAALKISRELSSNSEIVASLSNIGTIYAKRNENQKALDAFNEALPLARKIKDPVGESSVLFNIAALYFKDKNYQAALTNYNQSLEIRRSLGNTVTIASTLNETGNVYAALGEEMKATENISQAISLIRTVSEPRQEADMLYSLATLQNKTSKLDEARKNIDSAISLIESVRSRVARQELRTLYSAQVSDYYSLRTEILMNLQKARPNEKFNSLALESAENAKARSLLELLTEAHADIRQGVNPALLERERVIRQTLSAKANRQAQLFAAKNSAPEQKSQITTEIKKLSEEYESTQAEIRSSSPRYAALTQPAPISVGEIQNRILDRDTLLLEYSIGAEKSFLWVVGQNSIRSYELPGRDEIEKAARQVYELLTVRNRSQMADVKNQLRSEQFVTADFDKAALGLSRMILAPAADQLIGKRLLIIADGSLQYIPFGVLSAGNTKASNPLIISNEIITLPSASTLAVLRREKSAPKIFSNSISIVADPVFEASDARVLSASKQTKIDDTTAKKNQDSAKIVRRSADESGLTNFSRLRFSRDEADNIAMIAAKMNPLEIVDFEANKETVLGGKINKSGIIHFATHGLINSQNPELSGVVLSLVNQKGEATDGFLRLFEIYNLSLDSDLVVLSACQTALGQDIKGEGLIGLTRGFMYAGAPRVVASLWSVDDRATAELMRRFYRKLLSDKLRPAAALRAAQIEMRNNPRWREPYFWAAFTLQGEWR